MLIVTEDGECPVTCRTMTNYPSLNDNGDSSRHSTRPSARNYFFFVNFCIFPRFKVLQMMLHTLVEMLASEDVKVEE